MKAEHVKPKPRMPIGFAIECLTVLPPVATVRDPVPGCFVRPEKIVVIESTPASAIAVEPHLSEGEQLMRFQRNQKARRKLP